MFMSMSKKRKYKSPEITPLSSYVTYNMNEPSDCANVVGGTCYWCDGGLSIESGYDCRGGPAP